jgi:hypothetical protein
MVAGAAFAGEWQRNTFPTTKHAQNNAFTPGSGWSHTQAVMDISVSPSDPNFRAMLENQWTAVYTEDGLNYKPLRMPHIGTPGCAAQSVDFSPHDPNTMYLRVAHEYWNNMDATKSPAGLWRGTRIPGHEMTWEHLYQPPAGGYEFNEAANAGRSRMLEDPTSGRGNHIYFGTTSEGLKRSTDDGASWVDVVPALKHHRIKTVMAVAAAGNETFLYAIADKKMPRHIAGQDVPLNFNNQLSNSISARWKFNNNLSDGSGNGNGLTGTVASWTDSTMEGDYAAEFNGSSTLASTNLTYSGRQPRLSVAAWVKTTSNADQSIISFDRNKYWELGAQNGRFVWTVRDQGGVIHEIRGLLSNDAVVNDGDWHHVAATYDEGSMRLFVDGAQVAQSSGGTFRLGNGSTTSVPGVIGAGFTGALDDVRIYNSRALDVEDAKQLYLEDEHKDPIAQGQLWRIRVNSSGNIAEAKRLHAPSADFHDVEVDPKDPSKGWVIRKAMPLGHPYGGRQLQKFSNFGQTLTTSTAALGADQTFDVVMINPNDSQHVLLACAMTKKSGLRWSTDGGNTWNGLNRKVGDHIPSINSWMPMDHKTFVTGVEAAGQLKYRGSPFSFVPGEANKSKLLWIDQTMGGLLQSDNYGATWRTHAAGGPTKEIGQFAVAQSNPDYWSIGLGEHGYKVTTNDGSSWYAETHDNNALLKNLGDEAEADPKVGWTAARVGAGVAFHPTNPQIMVATWSLKGYILRSTDAGLSWIDTGFRDPSYQLVDVFWSRTDANRVYAGRMRSNNAGVTWVENNTGNGPGKIVIAVCDSNSDLIVGVDSRQTDVTAASLNMHVSTNGGNTWTSLPDPPRETVPGTSNPIKQWLVTGTSRKWSSMADALVAIDPGSASLRILLAGRRGIYEYNAGSNAWTLRKTGLKNNPHLNPTEQVPWMGFVAFDPRPGHSHIVYAASQNDEATQGAWARAGNPNRAYPGGENSDPYYRSTDGGITWEHLHGVHYPDAPGGGQIESMTVDSRGRMFAATTEGIYIYNPTLASSGTIIATVTAPAGSGNYNIEVIRDGVKPAVGSSDASLHYDTHTGSGGPVEEYIGYTFRSAKTFMKVVLQEGKHFPGGGWWANGSVVVQVRQSGTWNTVSATVSPTYPNGNTQAAFGSSFETHTFTLAAPKTGDGIRLSGTAGGVNTFISVGELEVIGNRPPAFAQDPVVKANATEDTAYTGSIAGSASDVDAGDSLSYSKTSGPAWLSIAANGALSGTPGNYAVGPNSFNIKVSDGNGGTDSATLKITVVNVNDAPVFTSNPVVRANATWGTAYSGTLAGSATDPDIGDTVGYAKISGPAWLNVASNGSLSGFPAWADVGSNSWIISAFDGNGGTKQAALNLSVEVLSVGGGFSSAEGYVNGELVGQLGWSGAANAFSVVTAGSGTVLVSGANSWSKVRYEQALIGEPNTVFTLGTTLSFTESAAASGAYDLFRNEFSATDNSNASLALKRLANGTYRLGFYENSGESSWQSGAALTAASLGTTNGPGSASDTLYLDLSLTKGATAAGWTAYCVLYNLSTDPGKQTPLGAFQFSFASSADFYNNPLTPALNSAAQAAANISNLRLDEVRIPIE